MNFKEYIKESKPINDKNVEIWKFFLRKFEGKDVSNLFLTFVSEDKVGINPKSIHDTPIGVYSYPLDYVIKLLKKGEDVPFRGYVPKKVKILKAVSDKVLSNDFSEDDFDRVFKKIQKDETNSKLFTNEKLWDYVEKAKVKTPFGKIWNVTRNVAERNPKKWSKLLLDLGFDWCFDYGDGIIHPHEPNQALFINPKSYKVIDEEYVDTESRYFDKHKTVNDVYKIVERLENLTTKEQINVIKEQAKVLANYLISKDDYNVAFSECSKKLRVLFLLNMYDYFKEPIRKSKYDYFENLSSDLRYIELIELYKKELLECDVHFSTDILRRLSKKDFEKFLDDNKEWFIKRFEKEPRDCIWLMDEKLEYMLLNLKELFDKLKPKQLKDMIDRLDDKDEEKLYKIYGLNESIYERISKIL